MKKITIASILLSACFMQLAASAEQYLEGHASHAHMTEMANGQYLEAQEKMKHSYNLLKDMLDQVAIAKLDTAQATWVAFSEAECKFSTDYSRGEPLEKIVYQACLTSMTEDRVADLEYQLHRNFTLDPSLALTKQKK